MPPLNQMSASMGESLWAIGEMGVASAEDDDEDDEDELEDDVCAPIGHTDGDGRRALAADEEVDAAISRARALVPVTELLPGASAGLGEMPTAPALWKQLRQVEMYRSVPPMSSTAVSCPRRDVNAAVHWHIMHTEVSFTTRSASGMRSRTCPKARRWKVPSRAATITRMPALAASSQKSTRSG